jgi:hypothetical protein
MQENLETFATIPVCIQVKTMIEKYFGTQETIHNLKTKSNYLYC